MQSNIGPRDHFAGIALNQMLTGASIPGLDTGDEKALDTVDMLAKVAYIIADAMMHARS